VDKIIDMKIVRFREGFVNVYFVRSAVGWMVIDAGLPKKQRKIERFMYHKGIRPCDIKLVIITHVHYDHVGGLAYLKHLSCAQVMVHASEAELLENAESVLPKPFSGFGRLAVKLGKLMPGTTKFKAVKADQPIRSKTDLRSWGFTAHIIPTPGHTEGSLSVVFESGDAFVGDACFNNWGKTVIPPFINDPQELLKSWNRLNETGAIRFYPGHGRVFDVKKLHYSIQRLEKKTERLNNS